jgi:hypothetical protein
MVPTLADRFYLAATEARMWREEDGGILSGDDVTVVANNWSTDVEDRRRMLQMLQDMFAEDG